MSSLANRLRAARDAKGWSVRQLAEAANASRTSVRHIERGDTDASLDTVRKLEAALDAQLLETGRADRERIAALETEVGRLRQIEGLPEIVELAERLNTLLARAAVEPPMEPVVAPTPTPTPLPAPEEVAPPRPCKGVAGAPCLPVEEDPDTRAYRAEQGSRRT